MHFDAEQFVQDQVLLGLERRLARVAATLREALLRCALSVCILQLSSVQRGRVDPGRDGTPAALLADRPVLGRGGLALICRLQLVPADPRNLLVRAASSRASHQVSLMGECCGE